MAGAWPLRRGAALPRALRSPQLQAIRRHRDRLELRGLDLGDLPTDGEVFERFNLSNVFEYLSPEATTALLGRLHRQAAAGARLVAWNRVADRDTRLAPGGTWVPEDRRAAALHRQDRVFFYRRLVLAAVPAPPPLRFTGLQQVPVDGPPGLWTADERWVHSDGAAASIWWQHTPSLAGERVGTIGGLEAEDPAAAAAVLR